MTVPRLRVPHTYLRQDQKIATRFIEHALSKLPFKVKRVKTDNGSEFGHSFYRHLIDEGIEHIRSKPTTIRLHGKVESS